MGKLIGAVGKGRLNDPAHVAIVQMCLKVLNKAGKSYYAGKIDGVFSEDILVGAAKLAADKGLVMNSVRSETYVTAAQTRRLLTLLPAPYKRLEFHAFQLGIGMRILAIDTKATSNTKWGYRPSELAMKNEDAVALVKLAARLASRHKVTTFVEELNITHDGRFLVRLKAKGGRVVNAKTAKIEDLNGQGQDTINLVKYLMKAGYESGSSLPTKRWELASSSASDFILRTKNADLDLRYSRNARGLLRIKLGYYHDRKQKPAIDKCLDIYELHRIGGTLTSRKQQKLVQCFGADWDNVRQTLAARKVYADDFLAKLKKAVAKRDKYRDLVLVSENNLRRSLKIPPKDWPGELMQDIAALAVAKFVPKGTKKAILSGRKADDLEEASAEFIAGQTTAPIALAIDPPEDTGDKFLTILGLVGLGLFIVALPLLALGGAAAGIGGGLVIAARVADGIAFAGETIKAGYDALDGYLFNLGLEKERALYRSKILPAVTQLANAIQDLRELMAVVHDDTRFSLADLGYSEADLKEGQNEIEKAIAASRKFANA